MSSLPGVLCRDLGKDEDRQEKTHAPMGRLTVKIHLQFTYSTRYPPRVGPMAGATSMAIMKTPMPLPIRSRGTRRKIIVIMVGVISPPPTAWMARATMSMEMLPERAHSRDPRMNAAMAAMYSSL